MARPSPHLEPSTGEDVSGHVHDLEKLCIRNFLETPGERVYFKDMESRFLLVSRSFWEMHGCSGPEEVIGKSDFDFFSSEHAIQAYDDEQAIIRTGKPMVAKVERETFPDKPDAWVSTTKLPLRDERGRIIGTFGISRDVTAQIVAEQALEHQALHDSVTGLPNRAALMDRLSQALLAIDRARSRVALLFIDLDNFKQINDSRGHEAGDLVLVEVARRLTKISRRGDTVARFGGDEFVLLCTGLRADDDVHLIASRVVRAIGKRFVEDGQDLTVTGSLGVVVTSDPLADPGELLRQADIAMYEAKGDGRDGFRLFDRDIHSSAMEYHDFDAALRRAIEEGQLFVLYQPLFALEDHALRGAEALVRWDHPQRGVIAPAEFIPLAEQRGLIGAVDNFVLDEACRQLASWVRARRMPQGLHGRRQHVRSSAFGSDAGRQRGEHHCKAWRPTGPALLGDHRDRPHRRAGKCRNYPRGAVQARRQARARRLRDRLFDPCPRATAQRGHLEDRPALRRTDRRQRPGPGDHRRDYRYGARTGDVRCRGGDRDSASAA